MFQARLQENLTCQHQLEARRSLVLLLFLKAQTQLLATKMPMPLETIQLGALMQNAATVHYASHADRDSYSSSYRLGEQRQQHS